MKKAYLAGPDVFRADAAAYGRLLKDICAMKSVEGLFPLDNDIKAPEGADIPKLICKANIEMIKQCDFVLANVERFRGPSLDVGTAFEIGYANALGKPVYAYSEYKSEYKKAVEIFSDGTTLGPYPVVEDFKKFDNLMIACSVEGPYFSFVDALNAAEGVYKVKPECSAAPIYVKKSSGICLDCAVNLFDRCRNCRLK